MPAGGQTGILGGRNGRLGEIWTALPQDHRKVFYPPVFYALSGLSHSALEGSDDEEDETPVQPLVLEPEERAHLQGLYDELVCKERVAQDYAKMSAGIPDGPTLPNYNQKSKKCLERIHTQVSQSPLVYIYPVCFFFHECLLKQCFLMNPRTWILLTIF